MMADLDDFDAFYTGARARVLSCVYLVTGDLGEAQDAVQEAFVRAWQRWGVVGRYDEPEAWVRLVACRIATSRWRAMRSRLRAHTRHGAADPLARPDTGTVEIVSVLRQIPADLRVVVALHYLVGLPLAEVAREVGAPVGTVKSRLARARRALSVVLAEDNSGGAR